MAAPWFGEVALTQKLLLVDFENVQQVDLARLDGGIEVILFVGSGQKTIPIELVTASQALGGGPQKLDSVLSSDSDTGEGTLP